jgi:hypothetical protein
MAESIQSLIVHGKNAVTEINRLRKEHRQTGLYPILVGSQADYNELLNRHSEVNQSASQAIVSRSLEIEVLQWFQQELEEDPDYYNIDEGEWPNEPWGMGNGLRGHIDPKTNNFLEQVVIGLLPVKEPWETFAFLNWGGWNSCPRAEEHCALHRYWYQKHGAQVIGIAFDSLDCLVTKPPTTREESLLLARELSIYNGELTEVGTLSNLAAMVLNSRYWYFWWD